MIRVIISDDRMQCNLGSKLQTPNAFDLTKLNLKITDMFSGSGPRSTKSHFTPETGFYALEKHMKINSGKKMVINSPVASEAKDTNLIAENYKAKSMKMKANLMKKAAENNVRLWVG